MSNQSLLERAFALAEGGSVRSLLALRTTLAAEGYTLAETSQVSGVLGRQLAAKMAAAKRKNNAAVKF